MKLLRGKHTDGRELLAIDTDHAQLVDLFATSQVKQTEADNADLLV